jgi:predicted alpha/beta superfamily hydrolase
VDRSDLKKYVVGKIMKFRMVMQFVGWFIPCVWGCQAQEAQITFTVIVPQSTPANAIVYIAGNSPLLGNWNPGEVALTKVNDSTWSKSFTFTKGTELEYKITLGSWNTQARYVPNEIPGNSRAVAGEQKEIIIRPLSWQASALSAGGGITGTVRYHRNMQGAGLNYVRDLIVWLPPSYEKEKDRRYPVLYMHDGQNIIDPGTSFIGYDWHVDEVADSLIRAGKMEEIIVVGISNSPDRMKEYADTELGKAYAYFVIGNVKPLVDSLYRTKPDRKNTAVMGSSMGGLISFLFAWWHPEVFSKTACLSSVFDQRAASALELVRSEQTKTHDVQFYFDCGGFSWEADLKPGMDEMVSLLKRNGYQEQKDFIWYFDPNADHSERSWAARIWRPLTFFFGKK